MADAGTSNSFQISEDLEIAHESIQRNRMDKKYTVETYSSNIVVPSFCTCCMKTASTTEKVSASASHKSGFVKTTRTISMNMPICSECLEHRNKAKSTKWLIVFLAAVTGMLSVPLFIALIGLYGWSFWILPFLVAAAVYTALGFLIKLPELSGEHSATQSSVWLTGVQMEGYFVVFTFTNWRYARLFAQANAASRQKGNASNVVRNLGEGKYRNRVKDRRFILSADHPIGIGILVLIITGVLLLVFKNVLIA